MSSRGPGLQLCAQLFSKKRSKEESKVAIFSNRKIVAVHSFVHLLPLRLAISIVVLNLRTITVSMTQAMAPTAIHFFAEMVCNLSLDIDKIDQIIRLDSSTFSSILGR